MPLIPQTVTLPEEMIAEIERLIEEGGYASISEFVRLAVKRELVDQLGEKSAFWNSQQAANNEQSASTSFDGWIIGKVHRGQQLGGKLGFPTLNLEPTLVPKDTKHGVYAGLVEHDDQVYRAAVHYGPRKTLGEWRPTLELHLLDFDKHIPGALVRFRLLDKIRETMRFESLDHLKEQLAADVRSVRERLAAK